MQPVPLHNDGCGFVLHVFWENKPCSRPPQALEPVYSVRASVPGTTSVTLVRRAGPYEVGTHRQSFNTPVVGSPMSPHASVWSLDALQLVPMELSPPSEMKESEREDQSGDDEDTASAITCSTERSRSSTPRRML